ncbi:MAG TPA: hypothetical protein VJ740_15575, partial [Hyphomicrobiaceae bacterium]|nr:hypothetical protein [Hyphomicrobiaceae bacterium]
KIDQLAQKGVVCPYACACAQGRLLKCASDTPAQRLIELPAPKPRRIEFPSPDSEGQRLQPA